LIIKRIKTFYLLNHVFYNRKDVSSILEKELGWEDYHFKHGESRYTKFIQSYYLFVKHGIDYRRATYSSDLCMGLTDRESALASLSSLPYDPEEVHHEIEYISKKLGVSKAQLEEIIQRPPKWYIDYDNNMRALGFIYSVYRWLHGKVKAASF